ncbi:MAG: PLP-dependent aminotransferase family protein [Rhodobacteraceae bacterium]|nr:PLP-dependent aminotransferase family protein [Paracoccaceae bacterium]
MKQPAAWTPRLARIDGLAHERLAEALVEDIAAGLIATDARLPAHRDLAYKLGLSVGTVTRAYAVLQRRGLARSEKGRGMFVSAAPRAGDGRADMSVNLPPPMLTARMLAEMLGRVGAGIDATAFTAYAPPAGRTDHRVQMARAVGGMRRLELDPDRLLLTSGAQHALLLALAAAPPGPVAIEGLTYPGALRAAHALGRKLVPLPMDAEGLCPEALERALAGPEAPRILYLVPSLQNPTGATMGTSRRHRIAGLARAHDMTIIEDDIYAVFVPRDLPALAELAPERCLYLGSLSKSLAPGLRMGYLHCPPALVGPALRWLDATQSMAHPLSGLMMQYCLVEGLEGTVARSVRAEAGRRNRLARQILGEAVAPVQFEGLHLWLPMPVDRAREIVAQAGAEGIVLAPPEAFMADPGAQDAGLRLCLGNVAEAALPLALERLARILMPAEVPPRLDIPALV